MTDTPTPATDERYARITALMKQTKAELVRTVRQHWVDGSTPPERWRKEELASDIADFEEGRERYAAYGKVALHNSLPAPGTRPHCGGTGCTGHPQPALPWQDVRDRYRTQA